MGALHGIYQIIGDCSKRSRERVRYFFRINTNSIWYGAFQTFVTFCLIDFAWIFFRSPGANAALEIIYNIMTLDLSLTNLSTITSFGLNTSNFILLILALVILFFVDSFRRNINIRGFIAKQHIIFRWTLYYGIIFVILIFGIYGPGYDASTFVYMQF